MNDFSYFLNTFSEFGVVEEVWHPLVVVSGLPHVKSSELVQFESGEIGEVFSIEADSIQILVFSKNPVKVGTRLVRTGKHFSVGVGKELLGQVIDPLGHPLGESLSFKKPTEEREVDVVPPGMLKRSNISKPFLTGVSIVDMMVPIGQGQKELIIGDRKTGKTSFILTMLKNQAKMGSLAIYAAIGRKKHDIKMLQEFFIKQGIMQNIIMVASSSQDAPSLIVLTPYTAMAIAEYFRDQGINVVIVFDDLSSHAQFYREISLVAKRFPGRDSYPGDIFYFHSRLLERSGNFKHDKKGEVSITCFPIVEVVEGDITGYITTNLMGMTDGHIFFDSNAYYRGRRPAVNVSLSVTRVGRQAQVKVMRDINRELTAFLALYEKMQSFSHFGAELTESVKLILKVGDRIYKFFDQHYNQIVPPAVQLILFSMLWLKFLEEESDLEIKVYRDSLIKAYLTTESVKKLFDQIVDTQSFNALLSNVTRMKQHIILLCKTKK